MFKMLFSNDKCNMHSFGREGPSEEHNGGFLIVYDTPVDFNS